MFKSLDNVYIYFTSYEVHEATFKDTKSKVQRRKHFGCPHSIEANIDSTLYCSQKVLTACLWQLLVMLDQSGVGEPSGGYANVNVKRY